MIIDKDRLQHDSNTRINRRDFKAIIITKVKAAKKICSKWINTGNFREIKRQKRIEGKFWNWEVQYRKIHWRVWTDLRWWKSQWIWIQIDGNDWIWKKEKNIYLNVHRQSHDLDNNAKRSNRHEIEIRNEWKKCGWANFFEEIIAEGFPNLVKDKLTDSRKLANPE